MDNGGEFTDRLLADCAIISGQSALDIGCGSGEVTFRLAKRVGPAGHVIGVDLNEASLELARARAQAEGVKNISFVRADIYDLPPPPNKRGFDLVTCRRVLMYLPDKTKALRAMLAVLRPGAQLALQEHSQSLIAPDPKLALNNRVQNIIWETVEAEGADTSIGFKLHQLLTDAGAQSIKIRAEPIVQTSDQSAPTAMILKALAGRIVKAGVATQDVLDALDLETLETRLTEERRSAGLSFIGETIFGALATKKKE